MMHSSILPGLIAVALSLISSVRADQPEFMQANVTASAGGGFFFKSVPAVFEMKEDQWLQTREAFGVAYKIGQDGAFQETWRISGWHTNQGYLSYDGVYFVRMGPWASGVDDLAIAFYDRGKLIKEYAIKDLIHDPAAVERSVSHLQWRPQLQTISNGFGEHASTELGFHLVTIEKTAYEFDVITGAILERTVDTGAKSRREIWKEESRESERKGNLLFSTSSFKAAYEEHFDISEMATGQLTAGVSFEQEWSANLKPKTSFPIPCLIEAVFPVSASSQQIEASLTPVELEDSFRAALAHPYISAMRSRAKVTGLRLRPVGDRLHWDHPKLTVWLARATGISYPDSDPLREWAYFILDCEPHEYRSFYLNIRTGELLYEDDAKNSGIVRLDAEGRKLPVNKPLEK